MTKDISEKECEIASELLKFIIEKLNRERPSVFKYHLDIIKLIVESWQSIILIPYKLISNYIASDEKCEVGIQLASIFLVNRLKLWKDDLPGSFLEILLKRLHSDSKAIYRPCAETVGLFLQFLDCTEYSNEVDKYIKNIQDFEKYILCLEGKLRIDNK